MWPQRLHTLVAAERRKDPGLILSDAEATASATPNWSCRPFQLAFVLVNLPAVIDLTHAERQLDTGTADLFSFPTGWRQDRGLPRAHPSPVVYEKHGAAADPWMTTAGSFNALRELGGMRRMIADEVANRLRRTERRKLANRYLDEANRYLDEKDIVELTPRVTSSDIPDVLGVRFAGTKPGKGERWPC